MNWLFWCVFIPFIVILVLLLTLILQPRCLMKLLQDSHGVRFYFKPSNNQKFIALTIDDTPASGDGMTLDILALLASHKVHATFFVIGSQAQANLHLLKEIALRGHEMANHDMQDKISVMRDSIIFEQYLADTHTIIKPYLQRAEGKAHWFRPGCGWYSFRMLRQLRDFNHSCILGDVYPHDVGIRWPWLIAQFILWHTRPGSVIIIHDRRPGLAIKTLKYVLPELLRQGYNFVTLSQLEHSEHSVVKLL